MKTLLRVLAIGAAISVALLVALLLYLAFGDLSQHKGRIERFLTAQVGRPVTIDGPFALDLFPAVKLQADQVRIANAAWGSAPQMLQVGHFSTEVDLWSLVSGPVIVRTLELRDVNLLLEDNGEGENNWTFGDPNAPPEPKVQSDEGLRRLPIAFHNATLQNLLVTYRAAGEEERQARVDSLTVLPGAEGLLAIDGKGSIGEYVASVSGEAGPIESLVAGRNIRMAIEASLGNMKVDAKGAIGTLYPLDGADLELTVENPDVGTMFRKLRMPVLADGPMHVQATLADAGKRTRLDLQASAGDLTANVSGSLAVLGLRESELEIKAQALDAARLATALGIKRVPAEKLDIAAHLFVARANRKPDGRSVRGTIEATLGDLKVDAKGNIARLDPLDVTELALTADEPDVGTLLRDLQLPVVAAGPMHLEANLVTEGKRKAQRTRIDLQASAGDLAASVTGSLAVLGLRESELEIRAQALDAARLATALGIKRVPAEKLDIAAHLFVARANRKPDGRSVRGTIEATLGDLKVDAKGNIARLDPLDVTELALTADEPDVGTLLRDLQLPVVAAGPMHLEANLVTEGKRKAQRRRINLQVTAGDITGSLDGTFAATGERTPEFRFRAEVLDAARLANALDVEGIPGEKLQVEGHVAVSPAQLQLTDVSASLGGAQARMDGAIARAGDRSATVRFEFTTDNLAELKQGLPVIQATVSGDLVSTPALFEFSNLSAVVDKTQLQGSAKISRAPPRQIEAVVSTPLLDLTHLFVGPAPADGAQPGKAAPTPPGKDHLFPDTPLPLERLQGIDARLQLTAGELQLDKLLLKGVEAAVTVKDGQIQMKTRANGGHGGVLDGSIAFLPTTAGSATLELNLDLKDVRAGIAGGGLVRPEEVPPTTLLADLSSSGNSPRQLASSISGSLLYSLGPGKTRKGALGKIGGDVIGQLFSKLNPFAKEDPFTELDCAVARIDFKDGKATIAPLLVQMQKVTVTADGTVDLDTEALALNFNTRPRSGIGISPGMFTNPFLELRGTLLKPTVGVGAKGVTSGALAAATAGATVVAKGVVDRVKGEIDLCRKVLEEARHPQPALK